jgi:acetylornithine deacetylase/succinyl-diaminopimelate desuccinylase-like protein
MKIEEEGLVKTLQSLVKIPSFKDSLAVSRWVKNELEGFGYKVDSDSDGNLIAEIGKGPGFILNAHLDTVSPGEGWNFDPFDGVIKYDKLYGRGSSDCKAGVAAMLEIARVLKQDKEKLKKRVVFTFTAFEESYPIEMNGVYKILSKLKNIKKGLILEPTTKGNVIGISVGCRGNAIYHVDIFGKRGHSAYQPDSVNPINKFSLFLQELKKIPKKKMRFPLVRQGAEDKITVTEIRAQEGVNVVPGKCKITIDKRILPDEALEEFPKTLEAVCKKSLGYDFKIEQESGKEGYYFEDRGFLDLCKKAIKSISCEPHPHFKLFRTDGTILYNNAGIGTFMIGPGTISQAHKIDEYCELKGLFKTTEAVLAVIKRWDKGS